MATIGENIVEGIVWWVTDPHSPMPDYLAEMAPRERDRCLAALKAMVDRHGNGGAMAIATELAELHAAGYPGITAEVG